ncbi:hypothetical protein C731_2966 [Mycolicibacterium hassiacum DSM 44199]|uniref:Uncharacterized protein n=1 Tax=Mycolicibacterium hassiacum (strain DSM 44199 / CIP 105218 / JCM 12690 / 3849) TaxID=1122247 RepID=K5B847_MYCHD|nr:hypothetical protein C731_2966 [Mycolicibacterium hassiacum DSM 44199]VCT89507.1 hypothetical protein MHAS_01201 [Mycolicibacterium hassiacum DSM 44199]
MSWTADVKCSRCSNSQWSVIGGVWTCTCGKQMTMTEIERTNCEQT